MEVTEVTKILVSLERLKKKVHRDFGYDVLGDSNIVQVYYMPVKGPAVELARLCPGAESDTVSISLVVGRDATGVAAVHTFAALPLDFAINSIGQLLRLTSLNVGRKEVGANGRQK